MAWTLKDLTVMDHDHERHGLFGTLRARRLVLLQNVDEILRRSTPLHVVTCTWMFSALLLNVNLRLHSFVIQRHLLQQRLHL